MKKIRVFLVSALLVLGTAMSVAAALIPPQPQQHAVMQIADQPTPTPTPQGDPPSGCGGGGC